MSFKRKIRITLPQYSPKFDPLRKFYLWSRFEKPIREDSSLHIDTESNSGTSILWSLGGYVAGDPNVIKEPNHEQMDQWTFAHRATDPSFAEAFNNDYLAPGPDGGFVSLPKALAERFVHTMDVILRDNREAVVEILSRSEVYKPRDEVEDFSDRWTPEAEQFLTTVRRLSTPGEPLHTKISRILNAQDYLVLDFRTIYEFSTLYLYAGLGTENVRDKRALYTAVRDHLSKAVIISMLERSEPNRHSKTYEVTQVQEDTPFVTTSDIYPFMQNNAGLRNEQGTAQTSPNFVLYDRNYELAVSGTSVPETVQPNFYIYDLYSSAQKNNQGLRVSDAWDSNASLSNILQQKYAVSATLAGNIDNDKGLSNNHSHRVYLKEYSKQLECNVTEEQKVKIKNTVSRTLFPSNDIDYLTKINENKDFFPMYIETSFKSDEIGPVGRELQDRKTSSTVLDYLASHEGEAAQALKLESSYFIGTPDFRPDSPEDSYITTPQNVGEINFNTANIYDALKYLTGEEGGQIQSLTISESGVEPISGVPLSPIQKRNLDEVSLSVESYVAGASRKYGSYLADLRVNNPSEVLGYKLSKFDQDGTLIQDVLFANSVDSDQIDYVDTQVKFDKVYRYELSEYRLVVGTEYEMFVIGVSDSDHLLYPNDNNDPPVIDLMNVFYELQTFENPTVQIIEVPIYGSTYSSDNWDTWGGPSIKNTYPDVKIHDHPPCAPDLRILPLLDNHRQVKIIVDLQTGDYTGESALPIVFSGNKLKFEKLYKYQKEFENFELPKSKLEFRNEGLQEISKVMLLRTEDLDLSAENMVELYDSFYELGQIMSLSLHDDVGADFVVSSYDMIDDLEPNKYYYYTCTVEDHHGNPSLPSPIYRVRLVYDKGLYIPEIELYQHKPISTKVPTKKFSRFIQLAASEIQTFPFSEMNEEGVMVGIKNLASQLGDTAAGRIFVLFYFP